MTQHPDGAGTAGLEVEREGGVARLWLARPERRNALDEALMEALTDALGRLATDDSVRLVVLGGRGKAFCAGADLGWMRRAAGYDRDQNIADAGRFARLLQALDASPKPTLARVHGACFAGAIGLVAACDLAVAADDSRFCFTETKLGIVPAMISPYVLRAAGYRQGLRYMTTAETFDAATALRIGLLHESVAPDRLDDTLTRLTDALEACGPRALAETKRLLRGIAGRPIDEAVVRRTAECIADARASDEARTRLGAVLAAAEARRGTP
jgi:methylglutaconyl-CoA hydratase